MFQLRFHMQGIALLLLDTFLMSVGFMSHGKPLVVYPLPFASFSILVPISKSLCLLSEMLLILIFCW